MNLGQSLEKNICTFEHAWKVETSVFLRKMIFKSTAQSWTVNNHSWTHVGFPCFSYCYHQQLRSQIKYLRPRFVSYSSFDNLQKQFLHFTLSASSNFFAEWRLQSSAGYNSSWRETFPVYYFTANSSFFIFHIYVCKHFWMEFLFSAYARKIQRPLILIIILQKRKNIFQFHL